MKVYKRMTIISALVAVGSFLIAILLNYVCISCKEIDFWIDVFLGLFSGAILTTLTSVISYCHEKRRTLEYFVNHTQNILSYINKYQESMSLTQKIKFYLDYFDLDKSDWDMDIGNMDFFFEKITGNFKYIYNSIYKPILDFDNNVAKHVWHFRWYLDGSGKNDAVMEDFLSELQEHLLEKIETDITIEYDDKGKAIAVCHCSGVNPKLVNDIQKELNGHCFEIMYGKKSTRKELNSREDITNGQVKNADS